MSTRVMNRGNSGRGHAGSSHTPARHETVTTAMDRPLIYTVVALLGIGLVSVYTASANQAQIEVGNSLSFVFKQALSMIIGLVAMWGVSRANFQIWRKLSLFFGVIALGLLLLTMVIGTTSNGAERWIALPFGFQFQASDFAKIAAIFLIAEAASHKKLFFTLQFWVNLALVGIMVLLILKQPNLSVSMILSVITLSMLYAGGIHWLVIGMATGAGGYVVWEKIMSTEYQLRRIKGWLNPWGDSMDTGYNLVQSYYAIGSGGLLGVGLGHSIQKLYYLPFQHTDFIFSVICEEMGFFGAIVIIGLFACFAWRGFVIAKNCPSRFGQMLAFGLTLSITLQAVINISVTIGLMPVTGVTLPLISYGGTSVITTLLMVGILLSISRYRLNARVS